MIRALMLAGALQGAAAVQATSLPVVGIISMVEPQPSTLTGGAWFRSGLERLGHVDGRTVRIEQRVAYGDNERFPALARELLRQKPALVFTICGSGLRSIRAIDRKVPVVAVCADWNNMLGEVATLGRPGGATTGIMLLSQDSAGKRLALLKEVDPRISRVAVLHSRIDDWKHYWDDLERSAPAIGVTLLRLPPVLRAEEIPQSLKAGIDARADALMVFPDATTIGQAERIAALAVQHRLPSVFDIPVFVHSGGLVYYGADFRELAERVAPRMIDRILKGASPAELPVEQPTKFELIVNQKTAKLIGVTIPPSILLRADRVIE